MMTCITQSSRTWVWNFAAGTFSSAGFKIVALEAMASDHKSSQRKV